jgi:hypothetical protein
MCVNVYTTQNDFSNVNTVVVFVLLLLVVVVVVVVELLPLIFTNLLSTA